MKSSYLKIKLAEKNISRFHTNTVKRSVTCGSFTVADFLNTYENLPIRKQGYSGIFSDFIMKLYVVCN